jgi:hypothetical protein
MAENLRGRPPTGEGRVARSNFTLRPEVKNWLDRLSIETGFSAAQIVDAVLALSMEPLTRVHIQAVHEVVQKRVEANARHTG